MLDLGFESQMTEGSTAMFAAKRPAEENLKKVCKRGVNPGVETPGKHHENSKKGISAATERSCVLQTFKNREISKLNNNNTLTTFNKIYVMWWQHDNIFEDHCWIMAGKLFSFSACPQTGLSNLIVDR